MVNSLIRPKKIFAKDDSRKTDLHDGLVIILGAGVATTGIILSEIFHDDIFAKYATLTGGAIAVATPIYRVAQYFVSRAKHYH